MLSAMNHPMIVHPKKRFTKNVGSRLIFFVFLKTRSVGIRYKNMRKNVPPKARIA
jgi:hypothetical protein